MGSISHLTSHTAPLHYFSSEQHLCANMSQSCYEYLEKIPKIVGDFLVHRYADTRMFIRAFSSMFGSTTPSEIERRLNEIRHFRAVVEDPQLGNTFSLGRVTGQRINARFERLTPQTQDLFFYTNTSYMTQLQNETDPTMVEAIQSEILRECDQAISFQRMLIAVNTCFRAFTGRTASSTSVESPREPSAPDFWGMLGRLFGRLGGMPEPGGGEVPVSTVSVPTPIPGVDLEIPNTVPYVRNSIPADIQRKANEIDRLRAGFAGARPNAFEDIAMADFMLIPVFDASHPMVQTGLAGLRAALTTPGADIRTALSNHRNARHLIDKDSLEEHIAAGSSWAPAKCMLCRHPEHGGIRREALRIDTGLQDEILEFLRRAAAGH